MKVSVVINTDGRAKALAVCLQSLRYLRYPDFEVIVVAGPTRDGTHELCESWGSAIKYGRCPARNLSQSRNIGIAMAAGDIVAYIDDDAVPEPEWLDDIVRAFDDPQVGVAGGFLHDHTGKAYQWEYGTTDRYGNANEDWTRPAPEFNFPLSFNVPHVIGANSVFRREALVAIGGFDEEFEYFLDETDVTTRIVDKGWTVAQLPNAFVHHKYMASEIRNHDKILTSWYSVVKNMAYFGLVNGLEHLTIADVVKNVMRRVDEFRYTAHWAFGEKLLTESDVERFEDEAERGLRDGISRGVSGKRRLAAPGQLEARDHPFVRFSPVLPADKQRCFVLLSRNYPPDNVGGVGRYIHQLARTLALHGHQVHVLTGGSGHDRCDFEEGVWVHRIVPKHHALPEAPELQGVPPHIWDHSRTMLDEAREIAARRKVHAVYGPIWDAEGIAFLGQTGFPLVTSLQTTLRFYMDSNPQLRKDAAFMRDFVEPMLRMEKLLLDKSEGIHAISDAIVRDIEAAYGVSFGRERLWTIPLGLEDWTASKPPVASSDDMPRVTFIGRLESRKGVDLVMEIAPSLLRDYPGVRLEFVGNDKLPASDGRTWREKFESQPGLESIRDRIVFRGEVSDAALRDAYRTADIVLAPSRFESFGLVHLEAAMYGKPVVGGRIGGMVEVVEDGVTGILAEPGDAQSLLKAVCRLLDDPALRERMGIAGRERYLRQFTPGLMARGVEAMLESIASRHPADPPALKKESVEEAWEAPPVAPSKDGTLRVAIVTSVLSPYDAISNDVVRMYRALSQTPGCEVTVLAGFNERRDIAAKIMHRVSDLLINREFLDADLVIYHFGIYYPQFDAILLGNGRAKQAVVFHNITPLALTPPSSRRTIEKSFAQLQHLRHADVIWCDSRENFETLGAHGIDTAHATILPLPVDRPPRASIRKPRSDVVRILFIGRIVPAKGVRDLVEALAQIDTRDVRVKLVGSFDSSDPAFRKSLHNRIEELGLSTAIEFAGAITDDERDALLAQSHMLAMPSYHEGFCVPVIEALRAGMVPVVYSATNLRYIADGLCVPAKPGDAHAFAQALQTAIEDVRSVMANPDIASLRLERGVMSVAEFESAASAHLAQFEPESTTRLLRNLVQAAVKPRA